MFQNYAGMFLTERLCNRARNLLLRTRYYPGIRSSVFNSGALF